MIPIGRHVVHDRWPSDFDQLDGLGDVVGTTLDVGDLVEVGRDLVRRVGDDDVSASLVVDVLEDGEARRMVENLGNGDFTSQETSTR